MENGYPYKFTVRMWYLVYFFVAKLAESNGFLQTKIARFGEIASWIRTIRRLYPEDTIRVFSNKDKLRDQACELIRKSEVPCLALEFGVAYGLGSKWWIGKLDHNLIEFHGFDRFTGLPRHWRGLSKGHFSTDGKHPDIRDSRVHWHVGDVEETLPNAIKARPDIYDRSRSHILLVILDLDILEPTRVVYETLKYFLKPGDVVHFDEAFDSENELIVLRDFTREFKARLFGVTSEAATFILV